MALPNPPDRTMRVVRLPSLLAVLAASLLYFQVPDVEACINLVGTDRSGHALHTDEPIGEALVSMLRQSPNAEDRLATIREATQRVKIHNDFDNRNDLGVALLRHRRTTEAIRLFLLNERLQPGRYETATNLGTALELAGQDATALRWIRIGIRRNPHSHEGTEWLHALILEAKLAAAGDAGALREVSIAGVDFGTRDLPALPDTLPVGNDSQPVTVVELNRAFRRQLLERMSLVKPKDPVVASLLTDWATLNLAGGPLETAVALYEEADRYGAMPDPRIAAWHSRARRIVEASEDGRRPGQGRCPICEDASH